MFSASIRRVVFGLLGANFPLNPFSVWGCWNPDEKGPLSCDNGPFGFGVLRLVNEPTWLLSGQRKFDFTAFHIHGHNTHLDLIANGKAGIAPLADKALR